MVIGELGKINSSIELYIKVVSIENGKIEISSKRIINDKPKENILLLINDIVKIDKIKLLNFKNESFFGISFGYSVNELIKIHGKNYKKVEPIQGWAQNGISDVIRYEKFSVCLNKNNKAIRIEMYKFNCSDMYSDIGISFNSTFENFKKFFG